MGAEYTAVGFTILFTIATSVLVGRYMFHVFTGRRTILDPLFVPIERLVLRLTGVDTTQEQDWKQYSVSLLVSNVFMWLATWMIVTLQQVPAAQPGRHRQHGADARVQHDLELHVEHEPATLQRRDRALVLFADVRDHLPAVRHGGDRRGGLHRDHPRPRWQPSGDARELLRRSHASGGARVSAAGAPRRSRPALAGIADDVPGRGNSTDR